MSVSDRILPTGGIVPRRTSAIRPGAEEYAFSLGLTPGGPGWGDAIRDYVLHGAALDEEEIPDQVAVLAATDEMRSEDAGPGDDDPRVYSRGSGPTEEGRAEGRYPEPNNQFAQLSPLGQSPFHNLARAREKDLSFREDVPKSIDLMGRAPGFPPLVRPLRPKGRPTGAKADVQKRQLGSRPGDSDTVTWANRIANRQRALPGERREISERYGIPLSSTPTVDRLYATMLAKEGGLARDGTQVVNRIGMVGAAQMDPDTARDAGRYSRIPYNKGRLHNDRAYNEMLGLDYYKWLVERVDGDYVKAAAAYNMGLGNFTRTLEAAARAGRPADWEKYIPSKETRDYVSFLWKFNRLPDSPARPVQYLPLLRHNGE
ncbi:MAG TPA: transglycosylase SLT domain-containing protein [Allosphingosinicella sp.]